VIALLSLLAGVLKRPPRVTFQPSRRAPYRAGLSLRGPAAVPRGVLCDAALPPLWVARPSTVIEWPVSLPPLSPRKGLAS
jgi:hypothetical protein